MANDARENGLNSLIEILVEVEESPPLRVQIGTVEPNRLLELRAGGVSLFIHAMQPDAEENRDKTILH